MANHSNPRSSDGIALQTFPARYQPSPSFSLAFSSNSREPGSEACHDAHSQRALFAHHHSLSEGQSSSHGTCDEAGHHSVVSQIVSLKGASSAGTTTNDPDTNCSDNLVMEPVSSRLRESADFRGRSYGCTSSSSTSTASEASDGRRMGLFDLYAPAGGAFLDRAKESTSLMGSGASSLHHNPDHLDHSGNNNTDYDDDNDDPLNPPVVDDDSSFPEVRAAVLPTDNITLSINTPRMWILSLLFSVLGSSANVFFSLRFPSVSIAPVIALLLVHPLGRMWDYLLKCPDDPPQRYRDGVRIPHESPTYDSAAREGDSLVRRFRQWLAQGRWNVKEHSCVYISSNVAFGFAFATDVIVEQTKFYGQEVSITYQLLLTLSTQIIGYAFAGLTRRFLVTPRDMIWPGTLASATMFRTLHEEQNTVADGWKINRWRFFSLVCTAACAFYVLPGLLMPALSYFNVVTWFAPHNVVVSSLFGVRSGLGLLPLTFDWAQVAYIGSPLLTPFWAAANVVAGPAVVMWILAPIAYYGNWLYSSYMPILSSSVFDNTGQVYDVSRILTPDFLLDRDAYHHYSRVFLPVTYVLSYGVQFAGVASLLTHTLCWHGHEIWSQLRRSVPAALALGRKSTAHYEPLPGGGHHREDVHNRLMARYKDAPMSWYLSTFLVTTAMGIFIVEYYPTHLPWYGLLLALTIFIILFIPLGIIMAITNQHNSIYLICQLICGALFPGRPVANMIFTTYGYISSAQGLKFASDLKLGHYMKVPPRILFAIQMVATIVSSVTQILVLNWMFRRVPGLCTPDAVNGMTCPLARVHFNGSILWGVIGPHEFFGRSAIYRPLVWAFAVGAVLPIPLWLYGRRGRHPANSLVRKINLPVLLGSLAWIPPATGLNFGAWALVCYLFNYHIRRRAPAWWAKYTMTLSAALDSGLALGIITVFFGFIYTGASRAFTWWGTEVYKQGCDFQACPYRTLPEGTHFGPDHW